MVRYFNLVLKFIKFSVWLCILALLFLLLLILGSDYNHVRVSDYIKGDM